MLTDAEKENLLPTSGDPLQDQGVDLLAVAAALLSEWRFALALISLIAICGIVFTFTLTSQFVATATILPEIDRSESDSLAALFSSRSPGGVFVGLLESRGIANDVIDRAHLLDAYKTHSYETARATLAGQSSFKVGSDSIVVITVKDTRADRAATVANAYMGALEDLNVNMARDQGRQLEGFFEEQLQAERGDLSKAEDKLQRTQQQTGLVQPESQMQIGLNAIAGVRLQISNLQVELASALQSETEENPQVRRLRAQIAQLQAQETGMETGAHSPMGAAPPAGQLPKNNLDYIRAQRDVKTYDTLVNSLASQSENVRLSENLSRPAFQAIDRAVIPEHKSWPPRKIFILISLLCAFFIGLLGTIAKLFFRRIKNDPANARSLQAIRESFGR